MQGSRFDGTVFADNGKPEFHDLRNAFDSNFSAARHPIIFAGINIGGDTSEFVGEDPGAPILLNVAVIQGSRKRETSEGAGPDVTPVDLGNLLPLLEGSPGSS